MTARSFKSSLTHSRQERFGRSDKVESLLNDFESGKLTRRQAALSLAAIAAGALVFPLSRVGRCRPAEFSRLISLNHVTLRVPDLEKTSRYYQEFFQMPLRQHSPTVHILGVGKSFFGLEQGDKNEPGDSITTISVLPTSMPMRSARRSASAI